MILTIDYTNDSFVGRVYRFGGYSQGFLQYTQSPSENRLYFSGETEKECLTKAEEYIDKIPTSYSRTQFRQILYAVKFQEGYVSFINQLVKDSVHPLDADNVDKVILANNFSRVQSYKDACAKASTESQKKILKEVLRVFDAGDFVVSKDGKQYGIVSGQEHLTPDQSHNGYGILYFHVIIDDTADHALAEFSAQRYDWYLFETCDKEVKDKILERLHAEGKKLDLETGELQSRFK